MNCRNCEKEIGYAPLSGKWYHAASYNTKCNPGRFDEHKYATPKIPVESEVCKHCGSTVEFDGLDWIHDDGYLMCGYGRGTAAEPESNIGSEPEPEFGSESNFGSEIGSHGNPGPENESASDTLAKPTANGRGQEINFILSSLFPLITQHPSMHMSDKLRAVDAITTIAKMNIRAMRVDRTEGTSLPQDDVYNYPYYEG